MYSLFTQPQQNSLTPIIQRLETDLSFASINDGSLNSLVDFLNVTIHAQTAQDTLKAIFALYRVFVILISSGKLTLGSNDTTKTVKEWLWDKLNVYVNYLGGLLKDEEQTLRTSALQILMSLQKHLSSSYSKLTAPQPQFHISHFRRVVSFLLLCPGSERLQTKESQNTIDHDVLHLFYKTWLNVYDDIRWFFLRESSMLISKIEGHPNIASNMLSIMESLSTFPTHQSGLNSWWVMEMGISSQHKSGKGLHSFSEDDSNFELIKPGVSDDNDWMKFFDEELRASEQKPINRSERLNKLTIHQLLHYLPSHRAVFTRAWLALLPRLAKVKNGTRKNALVSRALNVMHRGVMPHLTRPVMIMDWIAGSVDIGGTVGLLAFNALFVLMKEYNLDFPSFYVRLYSFVDCELLHHRHRARFFRMFELFLNSTHLPANLLASFVKRLSHLSLSAPPAALVIIIPFIYNILKRHPTLMAMIHRSESTNSNNIKSCSSRIFVLGERGAITDSYITIEGNPLRTQARLSSLWELLSHQSHYLSIVSTFANVFSEVFTKPNYSLEDFLDHTYATLYETQANRKVRNEPAMSISATGREWGLFIRKNVAGNYDDRLGVSDDVVKELWEF